MIQNYITNEILYLNVIFVVLFHKSVFMMYQHYKTNVVHNCLQFIYNNFTSLNGSLFLPVYLVTSRKKYLNLPHTTGNCTHSTDQYLLSKALLITKTNSIYANKTQWTLTKRHRLQRITWVFVERKEGVFKCYTLLWSSKCQSLDHCLQKEDPYASYLASWKPSVLIHGCGMSWSKP